MNLQDSYTKIFLEQNNEPATSEQIKKFKKIWWYNQRNQNQKGLRLTEQGLDHIDTIDMKKYEIPFPEDLKINSQLLIWLDRFLDSPYYISKKSITVIKEKTALEMYLFSGDIHKYGYVRALAKKIKSE
jgi:hypothetical protein